MVSILLHGLYTPLLFIGIFCCIFDSLTFAGKIKRVCETEIGIVSQCCLPKHASRPNKQYLENVALKINVKVSISTLFVLFQFFLAGM